MKKVLSVVLALTLALLACVPAFAATITEDTEDSATIDVYTDTKNAAGEDADWFIVTIPAEVPIPWGGTEAGDYIEWSYTSQLKIGEQLEVFVDKAAGSLVAAEDPSKTLAYTLPDAPLAAAPYESGAPVFTTAQTEKIGIEITDEAWGAAPVGVYTDTVTFTVSVQPIGA